MWENRVLANGRQKPKPGLALQDKEALDVFLIMKLDKGNYSRAENLSGQAMQWVLTSATPSGKWQQAYFE